MSFFPLDPPEDENETVESVAAPWWKPSDGELAVIFPIGETIARNDKVALILTMARVYSNGVELIIDRRIRRGRATRLEWQEMQSAIHNHFARYDPDRVRYGVVLGDGQQLISDLAPGMYGVTPEKHSLNPSGGNGGGGEDIYRFDDGMWLWPLPPEGPSRWSSSGRRSTSRSRTSCWIPHHFSRGPLTPVRCGVPTRSW